MRSMIPVACVWTLVLGGHAAAADPATHAIADDFETSALSDIWMDKYVPANRLAIRQGDAAKGRAALALSVTAGDFDEGCNCQRTEIREADDIQTVFGEESWYRFSLRLTGLGGPYENKRWMLGAWKQEADGSPFLAMRFEGGVFYITIESAQTRLMLASTLIDARTFIEVVKGQGKKFDFVTDQDLYLGDSAVQLKHGKVKYLSDPRSGWVDLMFRIRGGTDGSGVIELYANGNFVVRATGKIGLEGSEGTRQYLRIGHRRDRSKTNATLLMDDFRRGPTQASVSD